MSVRKPKWDWASVDYPHPHYPLCDRCSHFALWSIANFEQMDNGDLAPITRWFACGVHLNLVLTEEAWSMDAVEIRDMTVHPERS
jgi:hypothetical protein